MYSALLFSTDAVGKSTAATNPQQLFFSFLEAQQNKWINAKCPNRFWKPIRRITGKTLQNKTIHSNICLILANNYFSFFLFTSSTINLGPITFSVAPKSTVGIYWQELRLHTLNLAPYTFCILATNKCLKGGYLSNVCFTICSSTVGYLQARIDF